jgi:hypothetical protein
MGNSLFVLTLILILFCNECRGLAAVHSYDSTLCHRDVKSFNFLGRLCLDSAHCRCVSSFVALVLLACASIDLWMTR